MAGTVRIGLIGTGGIAQAHLKKLKEIPGLLQFQGIQETERELVVKIIPERGGEAVAELVRKGASACMPQDMKLRVETVKSIPRSDAGKTMAFVSKLR